MNADEADPISEVVEEEIDAVKAPPPAAEESDDDMPLPTEPRTIFLGGLFGLAVLAALYVTAPIALPVVLAIFLKLLLQPFVRVLDRMHVPRGLGALVAILALVLGLAGLVSALAGPAAAWASKLPQALDRLQEGLPMLRSPISALTGLLNEIRGYTEGGPATSHPENLLGVLFTGTATLAAGLFTTLIVLFYLLVAGETFMRRLVEILPRFRSKRQAVEISVHIERNISVYLVTITLINAVVGLLTLCDMWAFGVGNPLLWGTLAFILNYIPILGPMAGIVIFLAASVLSLGVTWAALLPVAVYFGIHIAEGEIITPMLMAHRFTINPVAVMLALVFWYWMWGVPGAVLAVPMLAITKIICDDVRPLRALGHFLEG
jgi:predicted PurR-regulated permease PerM